MKNIGDKIKNIASVILALGIVAEILTIISLFLPDSDMNYLIFVIFGPLLIWSGYAILYGFGELIEKVCKIEENTRGINIKLTKQTSRPHKENVHKGSSEKIVCAFCGNTNKPNCKFCEKCGAPLKSE